MVSPGTIGRPGGGVDARRADPAGDRRRGDRAAALTRVVPILRVTDAAAAVRWYGRLGFEQVFEHRFAPGMPAYVGIRRDEAEIHLSEHTGDASPHSLVYVWVDAVDPLAAEFEATVSDNPWARDFEVADPDGNRLRIAEPVDGG